MSLTYHKGSAIALKIVFLDRDGVINIDYGYTYKIEKFEFMPYIFDLVRLFISSGYEIIVVTNQSGIGRGYYTKEDFDILSRWMIEEFTRQNITIKDIFHCHHSPDSNCNCRKPKTGMIDEAMALYDIDLGSSLMIGDKQSDIDLADNASITSTIAIGAKSINRASYSFDNIKEAYLYQKKHKEIL